MAAAMNQKESDRRAAIGIGSIAPDQGLSILGRILTLDAAQIGVLPADWDKVLEQYPPGGEPSILRGIVRERRSVSKLPGEGKGHWLGTLEVVSQQEREEQLCSYIRRHVVQILKLDPAQPPEVHQNLTDAGMDSLMAVELNQRLMADLGQPLPSTLAFEYPTIHALSRFIGENILKLGADKKSSAILRTAANEDYHSGSELEQLTDVEAERELLETLEQKGY